MNAKKAQRWRCPECGRTFARARQWHSCQVVPESAHLAGASPEVRAIYDELMDAVEDCGPVRVVPTKTGVNLLVETSLGSIAVRKKWVDLGLLLTSELRHARVLKAQRLSRRSYIHRIRLHEPTEVDDELRGWIKAAYAVGCLGGRR